MKQSKKGSKKEGKQEASSQHKEMTAVVIKKMPRLPAELATADWFKHMVEEIGAVAVETVFEAQSTLLKGKFEVGKLLNGNATKQFPITKLVHYASQVLNISERELWYCAKFNAEYGKLEKLPDFQSKAISWNKVKKMLADPEKAKKPCEHENTIKIEICEDCGKRIVED